MMIVRITFATWAKGMVASTWDVAAIRGRPDVPVNLHKDDATRKFLDEAMTILKDYNYPMPEELYVDRCEGGIVKVLCISLPGRKIEYAEYIDAMWPTEEKG